jgi:transcription elongation factor GreA
MARAKKAQEENVITMTQEAHDTLATELDHRQNVLRKEIADEIAAARELGDLSENHAYSVAMERKDMNENRISEIEGILAIVKIVHENTSDDYVSIGEAIEIQNMENKEKKIITLVGSEESKAANPLEGKISVDSPIGKAVYNAKIGEVVDVALRSKVVQYKVLKFMRKSV